MLRNLFTLLTVALCAVLANAAGDKYLIGVGKGDITGPVVEIGFAGYANTAQTGTGLRQRLYARAFVVADASNPDDRFVYLVMDTQSGDTACRNGILEGVAALGSDYSVYGQQNVAVTGTHNHNGPGAWFNYLLPQITSLGFSKQSYQAIVDGAVLAIQRAHENLQEVRISQTLTCPVLNKFMILINIIRVILMLALPRSRMVLSTGLSTLTWLTPRKREIAMVRRLIRP